MFTESFSRYSFYQRSLWPLLTRLRLFRRLATATCFLSLAIGVIALSSPAFCATPVSLLRATNGDGVHFFLSTSQPEITGFGSAWHTISNLGYVYPDASSDPSNLVPLYRAYLPGSYDHYYTTDAAEYSSDTQHGWIGQGIQGYVYAGPAAGRSPIYTAWNPSNGTHIFTQDAAEYNGLSSAWQRGGIKFYLVTVVAAVDLPLLRATNGDGVHFFLSTSQPEITGFGSAWHTISSLGNVHADASSDPSNLVPLYRAYLPGSYDHYYTTDAAEYSSDTQHGWIGQGIQGYVYAGPAAGRSPIYTAWNPSNGTHIFTQDAAEYNGLSSAWQRGGIKFYLPTSSNTVNTNWKIVGASALNGDNHPGILWQNQATGGLTYWTMTGTGVTGTRTIASRLTTATTVVATADIDGNGYPDLVASNPVSSSRADSGQLKWWPLSATSLPGAAPTSSDPQPTSFPDAGVFPNSITATTGNTATITDANWRVVGAADFNGDGHPDLLLQNSANGQLAIWYMNGTGQVIKSGAAFASITDTNWRAAGAADFNGDGHPDILFQNSANGQLVIWYMNGEQKIGDSGAFAVASDLNWKAVGLADFDGDGHPDILFQNQLTQQVQVWLMSGTAGTTIFSNTAINAAPVLGQWSSSFLWGSFNVAQGGIPYTEPAAPAIDMSILPNGKVLTWSVEGQHTCYASSDNLYLWDPTTGAFGMGSSAPIDTSGDADNLNSTVPNVCMFCSSHSFLADGRLFVSGGHDGRGAQNTGGNNGYGIPQTNLYDWKTNLWSAGPMMANGRWYPSNCALPNGNVLIGEGTYFNGTQAVGNTVGEVYQANATAPGAFTEMSNSGANFDTPSGGYYYYPWMFVTPNGQVVHTGASANTYSIDLNAAQPTWTMVARSIFGSRPPPNPNLRDYGSAVMYDPGKVLILGGGSATPSAETLDTTATSPAWNNTDFMAYARRMCTATILADGSVLVTGGMDYYDPSNWGAAPGNPYDINDNRAVLTPELWDPATGHWSTLACMETPRLYHSTAVLLPDGRILSAGGGRGGNYNEHSDAEVFSPPYLFKGPRPAISAAPASVAYGQPFSVTVPDTTVANTITGATFIRLSSETHCFNANQRINRLAISQSSTSLTITAPANANLCPPGHYMLFLINGSGVPSVAKIIQIQ